MCIIYCTCVIIIISEGGQFDGTGQVEEDEEILIHTTINEMYEQEESNPRFESKTDPYVNVTYGSLQDELNAINDIRCIASAAKLKETTCRMPRCFGQLK